jgi:calcineurin-like phosphoesterase family protein
MNGILITSDTHWHHFNIISFSKRPFKTTEEMNEELIKRWNEKVDKSDTVYHCGDIAFCSIQEFRKIRARLNGKIILIMGNHDYSQKFHKSQGIFTDIHDIHVLRSGKNSFVLCHYPMWEWAGYFRGAIHCYGHVHNAYNMKVKGALNVGVDNHNFYPLTLDEVIQKVNEQGEDYISHKSSKDI